MKRECPCTPSLYFISALFLVFLFMYGLLFLGGVFNRQSTFHSLIITPEKGMYGCELTETPSPHYVSMKSNPAMIKLVSVTCQDRESQKIKKYTFTQHDGPPRYIQGLDNYEGWWVNSITVTTDPTLESGERFILIFTTEKPLRTDVSIYLSEKDM